jgi:hypothetical protein
LPRRGVATTKRTLSIQKSWIRKGEKNSNSMVLLEKALSQLNKLLSTSETFCQIFSRIHPSPSDPKKSFLNLSRRTSSNLQRLLTKMKLKSIQSLILQ